MRLLLLAFLFLSNTILAQHTLLLTKDGTTHKLKTGDQVRFQYVDYLNQRLHVNGRITAFLNTSMVINLPPEEHMHKTISRDEYTRKMRREGWVWSWDNEGFDPSCDMVVCKMNEHLYDTVPYEKITELWLEANAVSRLGGGLAIAGTIITSLSPYAGINNDRYRWPYFASSLLIGTATSISGLLLFNRIDVHIDVMKNYQRTLK